MSANNRAALEKLRAKYSRVFKVDILLVKIVEYPLEEGCEGEVEGGEVSCPSEVSLPVWSL